MPTGTQVLLERVSKSWEYPTVGGGLARPVRTAGPYRPLGDLPAAPLPPSQMAARIKRTELSFIDDRNLL